MPTWSQTLARMGAVAVVVAVAVGSQARADEVKSSLFGRWSVDDPTDKFSTNGKLYRVIDIAPCGKDFCGVSVDASKCGATLFRLLSSHLDEKDMGAQGHGVWGSGKMPLNLNAEPERALMKLTLSNHGFIPESRSGVVPTFEAQYHRIGSARCQADAPGA